MSDALTTQMLTPSLRRVYRSRAWCRAILASAACRLPTCTWLSPRLPRRNTSYSGQLWSVMSGSLVFRGMREGRLTDPGTLVVRRLALREALGVARAVARHDGLELVPVDGTEVVALTRLVPAQLGVRERHAELFRLRDGHVDEPLAQLVVRVPLDAPLHRLLGVGRAGIGRAEHYQRRPPGAVDGVLHHVPLGLRAAHHRHQQLVALALVERLFLADADHRAGIAPVRGPAQRDLVADRGAVHQPADHADIRVVEGRVVEDG